MSWGMFWVTAIVVVLLLIVASQIASVRAWAGRVFGRVLPGRLSLPSFGALGGALAAISGKGWVRLLAIPLVVAGIWGAVAYIEGRGADRERLKAERANTVVAEHEADIARKAATLAERTHTETARTRAAVNRADEELENAVSADDFDALYRAYRFGYDGPDGVWNNSVRPDRGNPAPGGFAPMHSPRGDRA